MPPVPDRESHPREPDPNRRSNAAHWLWFRRLMVWMLGFSVAVAGLAVLYMHQQGVPLRLSLLLPLGLGVIASLMLAAALMGLVFVSARSGIDDEVGDQTPPPRAGDSDRRF